ncbi:LuxR C-terminal-related transcriptional regulator [Streptomyces sp. NBC_01390]|uniref:LuxR C-terminal-related transcriptional regulator n=1 Tax=Streptomyces sp. NBC_01390 TaxID=2903850 RepID=UPI00324785FB
MSARLARPPASLLPLTPVQLVIVAKIAYGESTNAIASDLSLAISSVNVQVTLCGRKLGASGRAAVVHATFATQQLPRPERAPAPRDISAQHIEAWHMVAIGATSKIYAKRARTSRREALRRVTDVREFTGAANDPTSSPSAGCTACSTSPSPRWPPVMFSVPRHTPDKDGGSAEICVPARKRATVRRPRRPAPSGTGWRPVRHPQLSALGVLSYPRAW